MALAPITANLSSLMVPALKGGSAPGARREDGERLAVPGRPQAEVNRPEGAPGRIPVAEAAEPDELARIEDEVYQSEELTVLRNAGLMKEKAEEGGPLLESRAARRIEMEAPAPQGLEVRRERAEVEAMAPEERPVRRSDPLALDLDGNGLETTGLARGVNFDIDADGRMDRTSFISGGDAFLALDRNDNGRIDDGSELFGDQNGSANGYLELGRYDDNGDGMISGADAIFDRLRLLQMDGSGRQSLQSLSSAGIESINLAYSSPHTELANGDAIAQASGFTRNDGTQGQSGDLLLNFHTIV